MADERESTIHINKVTRGRSPLFPCARAKSCITAAGMWKGSENTNQNIPHTGSLSTEGALQDPQNTPQPFVKFWQIFSPKNSVFGAEKFS